MTSEQVSSLIGSAKAAAPALGLGGAGVSFPLWSHAIEIATGLNTFAVSVLGLLVLVLTIRKLWIDSEVALRRLRRPPDDE